jgi:putative tryptophan/tyrosine transport system substrate-binding protein
MRRRDFIAGMAGVACPLAALAQTGRVRRIGVLTNFSESDPAGKANIAAFRDELAKLGWAEGANLRIDLRMGDGGPEQIRAQAAELVNLASEVIVVVGSIATRAVQQQTRTIPIVFLTPGDPVTTGIVTNIARPEGNITGITNVYATLGGKYLELLKQAMPRLERVALVSNALNARNLDIEQYDFFPALQEASRVLRVQLVKMPYRDAVDIVHGIDAFAAEPNGALMVLGPPPTPGGREAILRLAILHRLPTISEQTAYAAEGGLMAYGPKFADLYRRVSFYVDRLLRGAKVSELPVEFPTRFELIINMKTAKAMGLTIAESFLLRADEVIE